MKDMKRTWIFAFGSVATAATAAFWFVSAWTTASLRFGYCGPASLSHADPACRVGEALLLRSYSLGAIAVLLAGAALWSYRRGRRRPNQSFEPKPSSQPKTDPRP